MAVLVFSDTGKGIAPEHLSRIFDPGFTTKGVGKGTGLGLSMVRDAVALYGGALTITRSGSLGGACIDLALPGR